MRVQRVGAVAACPACIVGTSNTRAHGELLLGQPALRGTVEMPCWRMQQRVRVRVTATYSFEKLPECCLFVFFNILACVHARRHERCSRTDVSISISLVQPNTLLHATPFLAPCCATTCCVFGRAVLSCVCVCLCAPAFFFGEEGEGGQDRRRTNLKPSGGSRVGGAMHRVHEGGLKSLVVNRERLIVRVEKLLQFCPLCAGLQRGKVARVSLVPTNHVLHVEPKQYRARSKMSHAFVHYAAHARRTLARALWPSVPSFLRVVAAGIRG